MSWDRTGAKSPHSPPMGSSCRRRPARAGGGRRCDRASSCGSPGAPRRRPTWSCRGCRRRASGPRSGRWCRAVSDAAAHVADRVRPAPRLDPGRSARPGAVALGGLLSTTTGNVDSRWRVPSSAVTVTTYVPLAVPAGTMTRIVVATWSCPASVSEPRVAVSGAFALTVRCTAHGKSSARMSETGSASDAACRADERGRARCPGVASSVKSPRSTRCETSSSGSWIESGSDARVPVEGPGCTERRADLGRRRERARRLVQGGRAGHVRGRHGRPGDVAVAVARQRGPDALAGRDEVHVPAVVGEVGEGVVPVVACPTSSRAPRRCPRASRPCRPAPRR